MAEGAGIAPGSLADAAGVVHPVAGSEARIVSLVPSITELAFDLGLGSQLVGRTRYCVHPESEVERVPVVGGTKQPDLRAIAGSGATHVLLNVDENTRETASALTEMGVRVVVTHPLQPGDNVALYELLGQIFAVESAAGRLAGRFEHALRELRRSAANLPARKVLYLIWRKPWMTVSRDTYIARTLALVNWRTVGHSDGVRYPELSDPVEALSQSDLVLLSSEPFPFREKHAAELRSLCPGSRAVYTTIDAEMVSWYGSRAIPGLDYLRQLALRIESEPPSAR